MQGVNEKSHFVCLQSCKNFLEFPYFSRYTFIALVQEVLSNRNFCGGQSAQVSLLYAI